MDLSQPLPILPMLRTSGRLTRLSTEDAPAVADNGSSLEIGTELIRIDTGRVEYWNGSAWATVTVGQKLLQLIEIQTEIRDLLRG